LGGTLSLVSPWPVSRALRGGCCLPTGVMDGSGASLLNIPLQSKQGVSCFRLEDKEETGGKQKREGG
jgi:hypothetical protein